MAQFDIRIPEDVMEGLQKLLRDVPDGANRAAAGAINKVTAKGRTRIARRFAQTIGCAVGVVRGKVKAIKATAKSLIGRIRLYNFRIPLIRTKTRPVAGGTYALEQTGPVVAISNTPFKQTMLSGHEGWFVRFGPKHVMLKGRYEGRMREPVKQLYAESPHGFWENSPGVAAEEMAAVADDLHGQILSQIDRFLK